jgi:hypothetical protein
MLKIWRLILTLFGLCNLSRLTFELAGAALINKEPVTEEELRDEFRDEITNGKLPDYFFVAFGKAVIWQNHGEVHKAKALYERLLEKVNANAKELYGRIEPFIQHNLDLLPHEE